LRFLVDMNLGVGVARWLREQGHDAVHLRDLEFQRLDDGGIFAKADAEDRIILTKDLDFADIFHRSRDRRIGVVIFRTASAAPKRILPLLATVLAREGAALAEGAVVVVEDGRLRVRRLRPPA
jgi:predicted nuclease of predicted toxin-antitoxin system